MVSNKRDVSVEAVIYVSTSTGSTAAMRIVGCRLKRVIHSVFRNIVWRFSAFLFERFLQDRNIVCRMPLVFVSVLRALLSHEA